MKITLFFLVLGLISGYKYYTDSVAYKTQINDLIKQNAVLTKQLLVCEQERNAIKQSVIDFQLNANTVSKEYEEQKVQREIEYKTIVKTVEKIVEKPVYLNECIDQEGLDLINQMNALE